MLPFWARLAALCAIILASWYRRDQFNAVLPLLGFKGMAETPTQLAIGENVARNDTNAIEEAPTTHASIPAAVDAVQVRVLNDVRRRLDAISLALTRPVWLRDVCSSQCCLLLIPLLLSLVFSRWWRRHKDKRERQGRHRNIATMPGYAPPRVNAEDAEVPARPANATHASTHGTPHGDERCGFTRSSSESFRSPAASGSCLETAREDVRLERQLNNHHGGLPDHSGSRLAAVTVLQRWVRTQFRRWVQAGASRSSVNSHFKSIEEWDGDEGAVVATVAEGAEPTTDEHRYIRRTTPDYRLSKHHVTRDAEAVNVQSEERRPYLSPRSGESRDLQQGMTDRLCSDSSISVCSASVEDLDAYRLRASTLARADGALVQPRTQDGTSSRPPSASSAWPKQRNVRLPDPRMLTCGELRPGPDSQRVFGELLLKCKHRVPVTFDVLLEEM